MNRLWSIVFWSILAAAFIGPGTVTTASSAGAHHGLSLLWALLFSTFACLMLQEASARLTVVSGRNLGEALRSQFRRRMSGIAVLLLALGAIVLGCAAYEAGNILGGVAGASLLTTTPPALLSVVVGAIAGSLLWFGTPRSVAHLLSVTVATMGAAFLLTALLLRPQAVALMRGSLWPSVPHGSGLLVLGLVGTTVVPYNLFLGSGLARGQRLKELRFGLAVAIILGGLISMGVMVVGAGVKGPFSFAAVSQVLSDRLGAWASALFACGLFAAGFSSAITAPLAAAITARSLFSAGEDDGHWQEKSWRYRSVWVGVLAVGVGFGVAGVRPVPAIIMAQALNGVLLPLVSVFLLLMVNDREIMGAHGLNGSASNIALAVVVAVTVVLGSSNVLRAAASGLQLSPPTQGQLMTLGVLTVAVLVYPVACAVRRRRGGIAASHREQPPD